MRLVLFELLETGDGIIASDEGGVLTFDGQDAAQAHAEAQGFEDWYTKAIISGHPLTTEHGLEAHAITLHAYFEATGQEHTCPDECSRYA